MGNDTGYDPRESFVRIFAKQSFARCLYIGLQCPNRPIRAHSIQNATHLGLLESRGQVVQMTRRLESSEPVLRFNEVGRNQATTFAGLCGDHDNVLFRPIEESAIDPSSSEHLFLLAYRASYRELYTAFDTASKVQAAYQERLDKGVEPKGRPTPAGVYATHQLLQAHRMFQYKAGLDTAYLARDWSAIQHDVRVLLVQRPCIAVSALFSPDFERWPESYAVLTVLPTSRTETLIVLSYLRSHARTCRRHFRSLLGAKGARQAYEVSRTVLNSCENFVIAPEWYGLWSSAKRNAIASYFRRTLFQNDWTAEIPEINMLLAAPLGRTGAGN
jgi:hypothetical protein